MAGRTGRAVQVDVGDGDPDRVGVGSMAVALGVGVAPGRGGVGVGVAGSSVGTGVDSIGVLPENGVAASELGVTVARRVAVELALGVKVGARV